VVTLLPKDSSRAADEWGLSFAAGAFYWTDEVAGVVLASLSFAASGELDATGKLSFAEMGITTSRVACRKFAPGTWAQ
jgi:hypothetical protein